jgi:hypothetical protein
MRWRYEGAKVFVGLESAKISQSKEVVLVKSSSRCNMQCKRCFSKHVVYTRTMKTVIRTLHTLYVPCFNGTPILCTNRSVGLQFFCLAHHWTKLCILKDTKNPLHNIKKEETILNETNIL